MHPALRKGPLFYIKRSPIFHFFFTKKHPLPHFIPAYGPDRHLTMNVLVGFDADVYLDINL